MMSQNPSGTRPALRRAHRTYVLRRVGVAMAILGLIYGGVASAQSLFGGHDNVYVSALSTAAADSSVLDTVLVHVAPTAAPTTLNPATPAPATTPGDTGRTPTVADPARVYIAGDSDAGAFAPFLERLLIKTGVVRTTLDYKVSSGLTRPDFYDWPARLAKQLPQLEPDIVIVTFGGNDGQPIHGLNKPVDSPEWRAEYARRVGDVMDLLGGDGRTLIWIGVPNDNDPVTTAHLKIQNEVVRDQVTQHPAVVFIDSWAMFSGLDGGYAEYVTDPRDGISKRVRSSTDGFHLNSTGADILALAIAEAVVTDLRERGAAI